MKELAFVYLALLLITIAGCTTTRSYSPYDELDREDLAREKVVKIELADGTVYFGTNLHFGSDWLSFVVRSDQGWPPPGDFFEYEVGVPLESIVELSNAAGEKNTRTASIAIVVVAASALLIGLIVALDRFCEGRDSPDHLVCN
jgi:hypothetical protein